MRVLEASPAQQRFWLLEHLGGSDNASQAVPLCVRFDGPLDDERLAAALRAVIARHDVVRSTWRWHGTRLLAELHPVEAIEIERHGSREAAPNEQEALRIALELAERPFDVARRPLLRVALIADGPRRSYLAVAVHHMIWDGWSNAILLRELSVAYSEGAERLPSLAASYWDYADRARALLDEAAGARDLAYWHGRLDGLGELTPLARGTSIEDGTVPIQRLTLALEPAFMTRVADFARSRGATPFAVFAAGLQALLCRSGLGGASCFGIPLAVRMEPRFEALLGCFVNTVALRGSVTGTDTFERVVSAARDAGYEAIAHGALPFEAVAHDLALGRDLLRAPLYQALFSFQNFPWSELDIAGIETRAMILPNHRGRIETSFRVAFDPPGPTLEVEWNGELALPVEHVLERWQALIEGGTRDPHAGLDDLPLDPRGVAGPSGGVADPATVGELLRVSAGRSPGALALLDGDVELSFERLLRAVEQVAGRLRAAGVGPGTAVALAAHRSAAAAVATFAILDVGGTCVPLDLADPPQRLRFLLTDSGAALVLCADPHALDWSDVPVLALDGAGNARAGPAVGALDGIAWILYTSGSTGRPKGVLIGHEMVVARVLREPIRWEAGERCCLKSSLGFGDSIWELVGPLAHGVPTVVADEETVRDPRLLSRLVERAGVTRIMLVPSALGALLALAPADLARLRGVRHWIASGEALSSALAERFHAVLAGATLVNLYSATECSAVSWHAVPASVRRGDPMPIAGELYADVRVWLLDDALVPVAPGVVGELVVGGPCVSRGYLDRSELTAQRFVPAASLGAPAGLAYRTGDLAVRRADGALELRGRRDLQLKLRGVRVELEEVERWLREAPAVAGGAVVPRRDAAGAVVGLTACVVPAAGVEPDVAMLRSTLAAQLPEQCVPSAWVRLAQLPLTPSGKLDRAALETLAACAATPLDVQDGQPYVPAQTAAERALAAIWSELLDSERIGSTDDFFALGGNSLLAVQVVLRIQEVFAREIPLREFYERPTIAALGEALA